MSNFFIRHPNFKRNGAAKRKAKKHVIHFPKKEKKTVIPKPITEIDDEEILSDDEEINVNDESLDFQEIPPTAQERTLQIAKGYLEEIEKREIEKLKKDEPDNVWGQLKEDVLTEAGKFRRKIINEFNKDIKVENTKVLRCKEHKLSVTVVVLSSDAKFIYSGSKDGSIVKWTFDGLREKSLPPQHKNKKCDNLHSSSILSLAISSDDMYLASSDEGTVIQIWDANSLLYIHSFKGHRASITGLVFCKETHNLYSCSKDKTVKVWSMTEKAYIETLFGHHDTVTSIDLLSKGRAVTSGGTDSTCRVWKIEEETQLIYNGNSRNIDSVKRLDVTHFISGSEDGSLCLWGTLKKKPLSRVDSAHSVDSKTSEPFWISSIACIPNTDIFASGSNDGFVRFWNCSGNYKNVTELCSLPVKGFINSMVFSSDNNSLILAVGQEHKLGRWLRIKEAKNSVVIINNLKINS